MKPREIRDGILWMGAIDWDRRLFDSLIPLPDGTSYNAYFVRGSEKTALVDTVDHPLVDTLLAHLDGIERLDYVVSNHAEQDHSGSIPTVLAKYPNAKVVCTLKARTMLMDLLGIREEAFVTVEDGEKLSLGDRTLEFIHTPWIHWPETMCTYLQEDKILFSCDFFGSHIATTDLYGTDQGRVYEAAKRYFAEIMMPFSKIIKKNLEKIQSRDVRIIAPSHGPLYDDPKFIVNVYVDWASEQPRNMVVIPYVSMHGSTDKMVAYLVGTLAEKGVSVHQFNLAVTDIGKLAITLVDAATIVIGTPTVHAGAHPLAAHATFLANVLRPKAKFVSIIGSYGWGTRVLDQIAGMIPNLNVEVLETVLCKGYPGGETYQALENLAETIVAKHKELSLQPPAPNTLGQ